VWGRAGYCPALAEHQKARHSQVLLRQDLLELKSIEHLMPNYMRFLTDVAISEVGEETEAVTFACIG
jgi:hypothetical protein